MNTIYYNDSKALSGTNNHITGKVWANNGKINKRIPRNDLSDTWTAGRLK